MTQNKTLNLKLSNSQLEITKLGIKKMYWNNFKLLSNVVCDSNDDNNFPHKLLSTNSQFSTLRKALVNGSSANIKISKTQKIGK